MSNSNNKYKTLVSNTMLISLGTFGSKLLVFFMVRFYTSYLTPADYGTADLITQTANLLFPLISLGITDGVFRFAVDHTEQRRNIFSVGVYTILAGAVLLVAILPLLGLFPQFDGFLWLIALYTMCSCFHSLCAQFVRAEGHTALYAVQGMINTVLVIGLNVLFLVGLRMGITGYVLSVALADLACTLLLFVRERLWRQLMLRPGWAAAREMLAYSIPMIPTTVFWWITSVSDRYMVTAYLGVDANGIYAVSYKMPTILSLVSSIFMEAWQFSAVSEAQGSRREHIRFFSKVWCSFQSVMFLAGACIIAFAVPEIRVLTTEQYYGAWLYVPVLGMAMVFSAFVSYLGSVYMVEKCSKRTFVTSMIGALLNIALNFLLIPSKLGVQGAAIATCASYFVVFVIRAVDARKFIPFRFYVVGVTENCILLTVQTLFIVLQLPGWKIAQAVCIYCCSCSTASRFWPARERSSASAADATIWRICNLKIWNSLFGKIVMTFLISMVPVLELRGAIPIGVAHGLDYRIAIAVSILGNLVPVPFIVLFIRKIFAWLRTKSERLNGFVTRMEQRALKKSDTVRRARFWGLFLFVAIPLPGTGAWTGSLIAAMLEMRVKEAFPPIALGVVTAGIIVAVVTYGAASLLF